MLAIGSLLLEGTPVRFTGQDAQRGTFSHRHAVLHDYNTGRTYVPLAHLDPKQARFLILNTMLSELAVLGFEYGFSSADPRNLVIWEAQFGDFVNGAQPIIDQFIAAAESKWHLMNGLVMLLPHGFEGQGPEHSNAYLNRFLALCAEDNMQVAVPTHPAQYFHLLRRQIHRKFRKPLVLMMPKSLLRFEPSAVEGRRIHRRGNFQLVLDDPTAPERDSVTRVLFCTGKIYLQPRPGPRAGEDQGRGAGAGRAALSVSQARNSGVLARYRKARDICWVQEEPRNRGAWSFMEDRLREMLPDPAVLNYFGRDASASPATGSPKMHQIEEAEIISHALDIRPEGCCRWRSRPASEPRPVSD